jgi:YggT family protein
MAILAQIVSWIFFVYQFLILVRVLLSWVNTNPYRPMIDHPLIRLLHQVTEPVLAPVRRVIPPIAGAVDISPVVVLIVLEILRRFAVSILLRI